MIRGTLFSFGCLAILLAATARSAIRLENRNLFLEFEDLIFQEAGVSDGLPFVRVYNSKSPYEGWFGPGWGSTLEARLSPQLDGAVVLQEFGGGAEIRFEPVGSNPALETAIHQMTEWASQRGAFGSTRQRDEYVRRLRSDLYFREQEMKQALRSGKLKLPGIAVGAQFASGQFQFQFVTRTATGFTRALEDGTIQTFDSDGKISAIQKDALSWKIQYDPQGRIKDVSGPNAKHVHFKFNAQGLMERISEDDGPALTYSYSSARDLVGVLFGNGKSCEYAYDPNRRHLLLQARYPDGTQVTARYDDVKHNEDLKYYKERNGMVTELQTINDPVDPMHLTFQLTETTPDGHPAKSTYEYFDRVRKDGRRWTYRKVATVGTRSIDTVYNECCGSPVLVRDGGVQTEFSYDGYGRIARKVVTAGSAVEEESYIYDRATSHLTRYQRKGTRPYSATFVYDSLGKLIGAKDSAGASFMILYGSDGRLNRVDPAGSQPISVNFSRVPVPGITLESPQWGSVRIPGKTAATGPQQHLVDTWSRLIDLIRRSNNPIPR